MRLHVETIKSRKVQPGMIEPDDAHDLHLPDLKITISTIFYVVSPTLTDRISHVMLLTPYGYARRRY